MIFDWPKNDRPNPKNKKKEAVRRRPRLNENSRTEAKVGGGGGGKLPPWFGRLGGSDWKGEKFGESEEKKRALHADPVGRRIIQ